MTYICFVESDILSVPHMEPLAAGSDAEAHDEATEVLLQHHSGIAAQVFVGDRLVCTVRPDQ
jgi:hypothetical protein